MPEVIKGRGGVNHAKGASRAPEAAGANREQQVRITGSRYESRAAGPNCAKKEFCHVCYYKFFVYISKT